jgi:hypothetical protein
MLDLNGQTTSAPVTISGNIAATGAFTPSASATPVSILAAPSSGAIWNSSINSASLTGTLTLSDTAGVSIGGYGNVTLNTIATSGALTLTKTGTDTLILNTPTATPTFNTSVTLGTLQLGSATALGAAADTLSVTSGAVLDLNGQTIANTNPLTISGAGYNGTGTTTGIGTAFASFTSTSTDPSSLGAMINTSSAAATYSGNVTLGAATSIGSNYINSITGITPGGNITLSGTIAGTQTFTKVGANTLDLTGITSATTATLTVNLGTLEISGSATTMNGSAGLAVNAAPFYTGTVLPGSATNATNVVTAPSTGNLAIGDLVTGTGLPAGEYVTAINSATTFTVTTATGVTTVPSTTLTFTGANNNVPFGYTAGAILQLDYSGLTTSVNRTDGHSVSLSGGEVLLTFTGSGNLTEIESGVSPTINNTFNIIRLSENGTGTADSLEYSLTTFAHTNAGTVLIQGNNLGVAAIATNGGTNILSSTAPTFVGQTTATSTAATGILPWAVVDDSSTGTAGGSTTLTANGSGSYSFATYNSNGTAFGIQALLPANYNTSTWSTLANVTGFNQLFNSTLGTQTLAEPGTVATQIYSTATAYIPNSLTFNTAGVNLNIGLYNQVGIESGGILATQSATISGPGFLNGSGTSPSVTAAVATQMIFEVYNSEVSGVYTPTTLTVNAAVGGTIVPTTGGLVKSGDGTLILGSSTSNGTGSVNSYTGGTTVDLGLLQIGNGYNSGTSTVFDNPLFYKFSAAPVQNSQGINNSQTSTFAADPLVVNAGGTFDLNANTQIVGNLSSATALPTAGTAPAIITNSDLTVGHTVDFYADVNTASDFAGQINGNLNFLKAGVATLTLNDNSQYTGATTIMSSVVVLQDQGALSGTTQININNGVLQWNDAAGVQA